MCGICGIVNPAGVEAAALRPMLAAIAHRGPDDEGVVAAGPAGLGSRRLSIIDLGGGHQPIANEDETIWVVFNGEIYNFPELRRELIQKGHRFRTRSDTEVIVHLYEELGEGCVARLRGMFAFTLWDGRQEKLLLARDHLGQKPLFYAQDGPILRFASEIKGILAADDRPREIDPLALHHYLSLRFIPPPRTMLAHIRKLPPAHILVYQRGEIAIRRYWQLSFREKLVLSDEEYVERLRAKLREVIAAHLISDVPIGAFLSGGMDSSMVVAMMAQDLGVDFQTFAIGVEEQDFNELPYARAVAERHGTRHVEACVHSNLIESLPDMVHYLDEPSDPIAACQFEAAALAARHVKVVLGGDGGDELFAGFDRYVGVGYVGAYARLPGWLRTHLVGGLLERLPEGFGYKSLSQKTRWLQQLALLPTVGERYAEATCFFRFNHAQKRALFAPALWQTVGEVNAAGVIVDAYNQAPADDPIDRMLYADYQTRLPEHSLMLTDRMTMAHGLELRSPFLDHELVAELAAYPRKQKIKGRQLKSILRKLGRDYLPPEILRREKQGFMFPVAYWFRGELNRFVRDYLADSYFVREGHFNRDIVLQLVEEHRRNQVDHHVRLWMLLNLAVWHELTIQQKSREAVRTKLRRHLGRPAKA